MLEGVRIPPQLLTGRSRKGNFSEVREVGFPTGKAVEETNGDPDGERKATGWKEILKEAKDSY